MEYRHLLPWLRFFSLESRSGSKYPTFKHRSITCIICCQGNLCDGLVSIQNARGNWHLYSTLDILALAVIFCCQEYAPLHFERPLRQWVIVSCSLILNTSTCHTVAYLDTSQMLQSPCWTRRGKKYQGLVGISPRMESKVKGRFLLRWITLDIQLLT